VDTQKACHYKIQVLLRFHEATLDAGVHCCTAHPENSPFSSRNSAAQTPLSAVTFQETDVQRVWRVEAIEAFLLHLYATRVKCHFLDSASYLGRGPEMAFAQSSNVRGHERGSSYDRMVTGISEP
jgi:hypothetical protein